MARPGPAVVAVLVSLAVFALAGCGDDGASTGDDTVAWCRAASSIAAAADGLDPAFTGEPTDTVADLDRALGDAVDAAPETVVPDLARVRDLVTLVGEDLAAGNPHDAALRDAWDHTDRERLRASIRALDEAVARDCGITDLAARIPEPEPS